MAMRTMTVSETDDNRGCCKGPYKLRTKFLITALVLLVLVSALSGFLIGSSDYAALKRLDPPDPVNPLPPSASILHVFHRAAVCTDAPHCSKVGREILAQNGSAVDAAIAAMFCNGMYNQQSMGLGGGFFMTVYIKEEGKVLVINAREKAPAAATEDMFHGDKDKSLLGPLAVGVPGELRGIWAAYKKWGKLPWESLVAPTLEICEDGFPISAPLHDGILTAPYIKNDRNLRETYYNPTKGEYYSQGTVVKPNKALCKTLKRIATSKHPGDELYNGSLAVDFLDDLQRAGSIITAEDLRNYEAKISEPLALELRNGDILYTPPPPSSGVLVLNILNILKGYNFSAASINSTDDKILTYHRIIEAFKFAYATRTKLGDKEFLHLDELIRNVTSPEYSELIRSKINDTLTNNDPAAYGANDYVRDDLGTAHISIIASNGDAVSVTSSINYYFGAGFTTLNTGILLNDVMDDFSSPGIVNLFGVPPSPANFIAPGKRALSSMAPSILVDRAGNAKLVNGASGGTKIPMAVTLATIRKLWFGQNVKQALDEPRIYHQLVPMHIEYDYGLTEGIIKGLKAKGHAMQRLKARGAIVCLLYRNKTGIFSNADYRKGGDVAGLN